MNASRRIENVPEWRRVEALRNELAGRPVDDPREALIECFSRALVILTPQELEQLRRRVVAHFGSEHAFVELLDGHVALRGLRE